MKKYLTIGKIIGILTIISIILGIMSYFIHDMQIFFINSFYLLYSFIKNLPIKLIYILIGSLLTISINLLIKKSKKKVDFVIIHNDKNDIIIYVYYSNNNKNIICVKYFCKYCKSQLDINNVFGSSCNCDPVKYLQKYLTHIIFLLLLL